MAPSAAGDGVPVARQGSDPIRTLIVDDHALFRRGLEIVLVTEDDIDVVRRGQRRRRGRREGGRVAA